MSNIYYKSNLIKFMQYWANRNNIPIESFMVRYDNAMVFNNKDYDEPVTHFTVYARPFTMNRLKSKGFSPEYDLFPKTIVRNYIGEAPFKVIECENFDEIETFVHESGLLVTTEEQTKKECVSINFERYPLASIEDVRNIIMYTNETRFRFSVPHSLKVKGADWGQYKIVLFRNKHDALDFFDKLVEHKIRFSLRLSKKYFFNKHSFDDRDEFNEFEQHPDKNLDREECKMFNLMECLT